VEERLVETGLILIGDDEDLVLLSVEDVGEFRLFDAVIHPFFRVATTIVLDRPTERDERAEVVSVLLDIFVNRLLVADCVRPRGRHDHRLGLPTDLVLRVIPEVFDDYLDLL